MVKGVLDLRPILINSIPSGVRVPLMDKGSISTGSKDLWINLSLALPSFPTWKTVQQIYDQKRAYYMNVLLSVLSHTDKPHKIEQSKRQHFLP